MLENWQIELIEKLTTNEELPLSVLAVEVAPGGLKAWECWVIKNWQAPSEHVHLLTLSGKVLTPALMSTVERARTMTAAGALGEAIAALPVRGRQYSLHHRWVLYEYVNQPNRF